MRILLLCHRLPYPPNKGDKIRSFREIQHLSSRHEIHLLTFEDPDESGASEEELGKYCSQVDVFSLNPMRARYRCLGGLAGSRPLTTSYFYSHSLASRVRELAVPEASDVLMVCGSGMAQYAETTPRSIPRLLDMVDVDSAKWLQYSRVASFPQSAIWALESRRLAQYEGTLKDVFDKIVLTTESEVRTFESLCPGGTADVVRNGVELEVHSRATTQRSPSPSLVFVGQMDYFANVDAVVQFATQVFPRLRADWPELSFAIVGRSPTREVVNLSRISGVSVTGEVEDVGPFLSSAWAFVAPLRIAQGVQNKVLEAMASGLPTVVSEPVMAGLSDGGFQNGRDLLVARSDDETRLALERLLEDGSLRSNLAENARSKLATGYSWKRNMETLERHLEEVVQSHQDSDLQPDSTPLAPQSAVRGWSKN